jgi:hypothetical protein
MDRTRFLASPSLGPTRAVAFAAFVILLAPGLAAATPCVVPNTGGGTVSLPPAGCGYVSPSDLHVILDGLPPGDTIKIGVEHERFFNITHTPGGSLGGEKENFNSNLHLVMTGTGTLTGFNRLINLGVVCQTDVAPRTLGDPVQSFDTDMFMLQGQLPPGDPDFDLLRITAGTGFGMPSPGHTTLTLKSDGNWNVDSFFDITYRIDFVGHPGGPLGGHSGSTTGTIRMGNGEPAALPPGPCVVMDNGSGTVDLPPAGCGYVSPADLHMMIDGLPPGTTINVAAKHREFFNVVHGSGGSLGGEFEQFQSGLLLQLAGTGSLTGFNKFVSMQAQCETHIAPRTPGDNIQSFDTDMFRLQGQLPIGDPDFDLLRITAGSGFGMPSPGHTTLVRLPNPPGTPVEWNVDSFFDITYRIDFVGHPGGPLSGRSGSTTGTIRMQTGQPTLVGVPHDGATGPRTLGLSSRPNPFGAGTTVEYRLSTPSHVRLLVYDLAGHIVRHLSDDLLPAGPHAMLWDGRSDAGARLGSGTYFIKLSVDGKLVATRKAAIIK